MRSIHEYIYIYIYIDICIYICICGLDIGCYIFWPDKHGMVMDAEPVEPHLAARALSFCFVAYIVAWDGLPIVIKIGWTSIHLHLPGTVSALNSVTS